MQASLQLFRRVVVASLLAAVAMPTAAADAVRLVRVWPEYRDESSVLRLADFFRSKSETTASDRQRTDPAARAGLYFLLRLAAEKPASIRDGVVRVRVIAPDASDPQTYDFPFRSGGRSALKLEVGLTGSDWPYGHQLPLAWRLEILDASRQVVAGVDSFLWQ